MLRLAQATSTTVGEETPLIGEDGSLPGADVLEGFGGGGTDAAPGADTLPGSSVANDFVGGIEYWNTIGIVVGLVLVAFTVFLVLRACRKWTPKEWSEAHGVPITDETQPVLENYSRRTRRFRLAGVVIGAAIPIALLLFQADVAFDFVMFAIGGYFVGALAAEWSTTRYQPTQKRTASLSVRDLGQYVSPRIRLRLRILAISVIAMVPLGLVLAQMSDGDVGSFAISAALWAVTAIVIARIVEILSIRVIERPQPVVSSDLLAADDGMRSNSVYAMFASGIGVMLLILSSLLFRAGETSGSDTVALLTAVIALVGYISAAVVFLRISRPRRWLVARSQS